MSSPTAKSVAGSPPGGSRKRKRGRGDGDEVDESGSFGGGGGSGEAEGGAESMGLGHFDGSPTENGLGGGISTNNASKLHSRRACNECRQQKLRCNVVQDPFSPCARCTRLKLACKIESNFKRIGKRSRHAEMERDLEELRRRLALYEGNGQPQAQAHGGAGPQPIATTNATGLEIAGLPDDAVASLIDLRQGAGSSRRLGQVMLDRDQIRELFDQFFLYYHPFLPILDPERPPEHFFNVSELLFWTIVTIGSRRYGGSSQLLTALAPAVSKLVWATLSDVPQSFHVVKALCLLCTWPLPASSTSGDATFMLSGVLMQIAFQIGLHRPSHVQDFTRFQVQLREEELRDKVRTWAACNIVAQSVSTGYGQPPSTLYDWTLEQSASRDVNYRLPPQIAARLRIERFADKVTKGLYSTRNDPVGLATDDERAPITGLLGREYERLQMELGSDLEAINALHLHAAGLHLRLSAFFDDSTSYEYERDLLSLYLSATRFLESALNLSQPDLSYATNYILQMILAGSFALLKLLNSFFARHVDFEHGKRLFQQTIWAIRKISVIDNDLPCRLAEVLAQLWRGGSNGGSNAGGPSSVLSSDDEPRDSSLQLKVRCRMSMSLMFDSVWRWREEFLHKGRGNLDAAGQHPTNPDSTAESSASSTAAGDGMGVLSGAGRTSTPGMLNVSPGPAGLVGQDVGAGNLTPIPMANNLVEPTYEVFDPLNWMLDGLMDFPSAGVVGQGMLEPQGMG